MSNESGNDPLRWAIAVLRSKGCKVDEFLQAGEPVLRVGLPGCEPSAMLPEHVVSMALGALMKQSVSN